MKMNERDYTVSFLTPAFLGNAEQSGQWRTPPFKALLRQWWRVAYAADHGFNVTVADMRREEGLLFGNAWLQQEGSRKVAEHRKSLVRIRLNRWDVGRLKSWEGLEQGTVFHPEVRQTGYKVDPYAYLGYGPLLVEKAERKGQKPEYATVLKKNAAIQAGEAATLSLAWPTQYDDRNLQELLDRNDKRIEHALWLMDRYGTLGGRSRNGWGSLAFVQKNDTLPQSGKVPLRDWQACLDRDWPHAIGQDGKGPLIWGTQPHKDWKALMKTLAIVKIGLRTQKHPFEFIFDEKAGDKKTKDGINHGRPQARHWLSYPVTDHSVQSWSGLRLPNQLRFKVRKMEDGQFVGVIYHMPCLPPRAFRPNQAAITEVWKRVHALLDELCKPSSARRYASITDAERRSALAPHLNGLMLERIRI